MQRTPTGIIGACLTPWTADDAVDGDALVRLLDFMTGHCDAISILGAEASEYQVLTDSQRREWLRRGIEIVGGRVPVVAGASSPAIREVAELSELARDAGADFVQVLMPKRPWGPEASPAEIVAYFEAAAHASALPLVVYHNPTRGSDPPLETFLRIAEIDGVVAFKESSRDTGKIGRLVHELRDAEVDYFTTMQPLLATLMHGGAGAMMPAPATLLGAEVVAAVRARDLERAVAAQERFAIFPNRWRGYGLGPVMRSALRHLGVDIGHSHTPFSDVTPADDAAIGRFLAAAGVTSVAA